MAWQPFSATNKIRATFLASEWGSSNGGLSTINRELAIQLAKCPEVQITYLVPQCSEGDKRTALSHNIKIVKAKRWVGFDELECLCFPPDHLKIDVIVGHGVKLGRQAPVIRTSHKCKWIQVVHTDPEELGMFKSYQKPISTGEKKHNTEVELCSLADLVVGVGPKLSEAYRSFLRWCKKDQTILDFTPGVFNEFVNVEHVAEERKRCGVLVFGRGDAEDFQLKGFDIAGKAVAELNDTHLIFVGAPEGKHEEIAARFLKCGIPAKRLAVRSFMQSREVLRRLFCEVDLVLMPSRTEGFGLTGLEALSAGLPVLVSKNSGFGEALQKVPYGSSCVIDSEDPKVWTQAIKKIWNKDRKARLQRAVELRNFYKKKYNWDKQCKCLVSKMIDIVNDCQNSIQRKDELPLSSHTQATQKKEFMTGERYPVDCQSSTQRKGRLPLSSHTQATQKKEFVTSENYAAMTTIHDLQQMQCDVDKFNKKTRPSQNLQKIISEKGFIICDNPGSGNCMFYALSEQLQSVKGIQISHKELRKTLVHFLRFSPYLPDGTDLFNFVHGYPSWTDFLRSMEKDGTWGDHLILLAAANCYKTRIHVISSLNSDVIISPPDHLVGNTNPLVLGHIYEKHYVSLRPRQGSEPTERQQKERNVSCIGADVKNLCSSLPNKQELHVFRTRIEYPAPVISEELVDSDSSSNEDSSTEDCGAEAMAMMSLAKPLSTSIHQSSFCANIWHDDEKDSEQFSECDSSPYVLLPHPCHEEEHPEKLGTGSYVTLSTLAPGSMSQDKARDFNILQSSFAFQNTDDDSCVPSSSVQSPAGNTVATRRSALEPCCQNAEHQAPRNTEMSPYQEHPRIKDASHNVPEMGFVNTPYESSDEFLGSFCRDSVQKGMGSVALAELLPNIEDASFEEGSSPLITDLQEESEADHTDFPGAVEMSLGQFSYPISNVGLELDEISEQPSALKQEHCYCNSQPRTDMELDSAKVYTGYVSNQEFHEHNRQDIRSSLEDSQLSLGECSHLLSNVDIGRTKMAEESFSVFEEEHSRYSLQAYVDMKLCGAKVPTGYISTHELHNHNSLLKDSHGVNSYPGLDPFNVRPRSLTIRTPSVAEEQCNLLPELMNNTAFGKVSDQKNEDVAKTSDTKLGPLCGPVGYSPGSPKGGFVKCCSTAINYSPTGTSVNKEAQLVKSKVHHSEDESLFEQAPNKSPKKEGQNSVAHHSRSLPSAGIWPSSDVVQRGYKPRKSTIDSCSSWGNKPITLDMSKIPPQLRIRFEQLRIQGFLGQGQFGEVRKATIVSTECWMNPKKEDVAVKVLRDTATAKDSSDFIKEVQTMIVLESKQQCKYIIKLRGVSKDPNGKLMLVTELAPLGSLRAYLPKNKEILRLPQLLDFCMQICKGMRYLENQSLLHKDLAARNILVMREDLVKISDFGLSRLQDYYKIQESSKVPVKWYALESLLKNRFTTKSDVWSFGVTMWEIFSYGGSPYGDMQSYELLPFLEKGYRLPCPEACPQKVYDVMYSCWLKDATRRPSFYLLDTTYLAQLQEEYLIDNF